MNGPDGIARLRTALARAGLPEKPQHAPLGHRAADAALRGGLKRGALHEVFAAPGHEGAATGFAAGLAARLAGNKPLLWIRQDYSALEFGELSATGLLEFGLDPSRIFLFAAANAEDCLRAGLDALSCAALGAVAIEIPGAPKILDLVASRRFTLASAQKNVTAILLRFAAAPDASTAETRWCVRAASKKEGRPVFETELVRNRGGRTGHWVMEWDCDEACFAADRGAVVSAPCNRPVQAAMRVA
jgi:protein ImuA